MYYPTNKIRCATYGRGIWESDFQDSTSTTGIAETENSFVNVYPNPSRGSFKITYSKSLIKEIEIYNAVGEKVFSKLLNSYSANLVIPFAENGIYFIALKMGKTTIYKKLILT